MDLLPFQRNPDLTCHTPTARWRLTRRRVKICKKSGLLPNKGGGLWLYLGYSKPSAADVVCADNFVENSSWLFSYCEQCRQLFEMTMSLLPKVKDLLFKSQKSISV